MKKKVVYTGDGIKDLTHGKEYLVLSDGPATNEYYIEDDRANRKWYKQYLFKVQGQPKKIEANAVLKQAIETYGQDLQECVAIEEMSELIKEICKEKRGSLSKLHMAEEMADVEIMIQQLKIMYGNEKLVEVYKEKKIKRLQERLSYK